MINKVKNLNWTAIITWSIIIYITYSIWNYIF